MTSSLTLVPDASLRRRDGGRLLIGGSPLRVLRVSAAAAELVRGWLHGETVSERDAHRGLAGRLVRAGIAHPRYASSRLHPADVTVVIPARNDPRGVTALRESLTDVTAVHVVDDGSASPLPGALTRHEYSRGPAAARNAGVAAATTELIAFLDADTRVSPGWLEPLLAHFEDPSVVAVAPRVCSTPGPGALARYERGRSSLDLGSKPGAVRPGSRVSYVPSAALVVRRATLEALGGFDERMCYGEDVDLVWRIVAGGGQVRYEPGSRVEHTPRANWARWARQHYSYGTAAAPLAARHGNAVAPVKVSAWSAASWALGLAGHPLAGLALAAGSTAALPRKLAPMTVPASESLRLAAVGHLGAARLLADAAMRTWWPISLPCLAISRRGRLLLALLAARYLAEWRPSTGLGPLRWWAARVVDDLAYGAGVWRGCRTERSARALLPNLTDWPGRGT
jgi:mycofactocin system glycosyltransferase